MGKYLKGVMKNSGKESVLILKKNEDHTEFIKDFDVIKSGGIFGVPPFDSFVVINNFSPESNIKPDTGDEELLEEIICG